MWATDWVDTMETVFTVDGDTYKVIPNAVGINELYEILCRLQSFIMIFRGMLMVISASFI